MSDRYEKLKIVAFQEEKKDKKEKRDDKKFAAFQKAYREKTFEKLFIFFGKGVDKPLFLW